MSAAALLDKLERVRQTGPGRWLACCPAHADRSPSLSVRELDDGRVLVHDFAGCGVEEIVAAVGLDLDVLFPERATAGDFARGERRPFPATDVLRALADEAQLVAVAAANLGRGIALSDADRERLLAAAERIASARSLALGSAR
ncbi:MAG: DNA primase [Betaproteobacteria bacterium]|nr:DNA primase [Betaproteobacteria bacterium]